MVSVNKEAMKLVREILNEEERIGVKASNLSNGTTVIDMGLSVPGGWEAGRKIVEVSLGGLASVNYGLFSLEDIELPTVQVFTDRPVISCLMSQISGWALNDMKNSDGIVPLISGPIRAIVKKDMFAVPFEYQDSNPEAVAVLQDNRMPTIELTNYMADEAKIKPEDLYVLVAPTRSLTGFINVVSRTLETSIWRLHVKGLDVNKVTSAWGSAPIPPLTNNEFGAMVKVNTFTYYGGSAGFILDEEDQKIEKILNELTLSPETTDQYGIPFGQLLQKAGGDIFNMKDFCHSVARIDLQNIRTGNVFGYGSIDKDVLYDCITRNEKSDS